MDKAFIPAEAVRFSNLHTVIEWFITLRWIAGAGVLLTLLILRNLLKVPLPYSLLFGANVLLLLANSLYRIYLVSLKKKVLTDQEKKLFLHIQIISDYFLLLLLVYFTGFLENPMIYFLVFHIMLTSFLFNRKILAVYTISTVGLLILLSILQSRNYIPYYALTLSLSPAEPAYFDRMIYRMTGLSFTLAISAYLISSIKDRIDFKGKLCEVELSRYKSLDKVKSNFILQVTHELRGPLAAVIGYHEIILKGLTGELPEKTDRLLRKANRRTDNLLTMIGEMIDFAYMKSEKDVHIDDKEIRVSDLINDNIILVRESAAKKKISFTVNCATSIQIRTNRDLFNMILGNLITNAIKYSGENGEISVTCSREKNKIHLEVADRGMGIHPDDLEKIFEEFYRTREARNLEKDGTGLGLAIVKRAVNSLKGQIDVYSRQDEGTSFHIHLPLTYSKEA